MSLNTTAQSNTSQQNILSLNKTAWSGPYQNKDLYTIRKCITDIEQLPIGEKRVLEFLLCNSWNGRMIYMGQQYIADKLRYKRTYVNTLLQRLRKKGFISWVQREWDTNVYFVAIAMLTHEFIRRTINFFKGSAPAWYRRMVFFSAGILMLQTPLPVQELTLRNCIKDFNLKSNRIYRISNVEVIREATTIDDKTKKIGRMTMNEQKKSKSNEAMADKGFDFNDAAIAELSMFSDETKIKATERYAFAAKKSTIATPWGYFFTIAKQIARDNGEELDRIGASTMRAALGIKESEPRTLEYVAIASDNKPVKTPSKGISKASSGLVELRRDEKYIYYRQPNGQEIKFKNHYTPSGEFKNDYRDINPNFVDVGVPWNVSNPGQEETPEHIEETVLAYLNKPEYTNVVQSFGKEYMNLLMKSLLSDARKKRTGMADEMILGSKLDILKTLIGPNITNINTNKNGSNFNENKEDAV